MKVWSAYTLSVMYTHEGDEFTAGGWPQVTLGDFHEQVEGILLTAHAGAKSVSFAPLVMGDDRATWETYAAAEYAHEHSAGDAVNETASPVGVRSVPQQKPSVWEDERDGSNQSIFGANDRHSRRRGLLGLLRGGSRQEIQPRRDLLVDSGRTVEDGIFGVADGVAHDQEEGHDFYLPAWQIGKFHLYSHLSATMFESYFVSAG